MKYVLIQAANNSSEFKKGDRIVVQVNDEAFLATVTGVRSGQIYLQFDDGDTGKVSVGSKRILGRGVDKKVKKALSKTEVKKYLDQSKSVEQEKNRKTPSSRKATKTQDQDLKIDDLIQVYNQLQHLFPKDMDFISKGKNIDLGGTFSITGVEEINILERYLKEYFKQERRVVSHKRKVFCVWVNKNNTVGISTTEELNTRKNRDKNTKMQVNFFIIDSD